MANIPGVAEGRAAAMCAQFDRTFAEPPASALDGMLDFLSIRIEDCAYALALGEVAGISARRPITRLPAATPGLIGLASFRGIIAPVYDLHILLGHAAVEKPDWLALAAAAPVAFALASIEGHLRVPSDRVVAGDATGAGSYIGDSIELDGRATPIARIPAILNALGAIQSKT